MMREYQRRVDQPGNRFTEREVLNALTSAYSSPAREKAQRRPDPRTGSSHSEEGASGTGGGGLLSAYEEGDQMRGSDPQRSRQDEAEEVILFDSFLFSSIRRKLNSSGFVELGEQYPDLLTAMQEVDALPSDGIVQHQGTNAIERRRRQYNILTGVWGLAFPEDTLPKTRMSTWLNLAAKTEPGMEGEVMDAIVNYLAAPHNGPVRHPHTAVPAIRNAVDQDGQAERKAKRNAERAEYRKGNKPNAPTKANAPQAESQPMPTYAPTPKPQLSSEEGDAAWEALLTKGNALGMTFTRGDQERLAYLTPIVEERWAARTKRDAA